MPTGKTLSRDDDYLVRSWIADQYKVRLRQFALLRLTPEQAVKELKKLDPTKFRDLTVADIERAARL